MTCRPYCCDTQVDTIALNIQNMFYIYSTLVCIPVYISMINVITFVFKATPRVVTYALNR